MPWVFYMLCFTYLRRKSTRKVLSTFPFYRWGNWGTEALMKLLVSEWDAFSWAYSCICSKLCGKGNVYLDWWEKNTRFQFYLQKKANLNMLLRSTKHVLVVLDTGLHLIEKKSTSKVLSIFPFYRWGNWGWRH